jgi:hypothetical protein
LLLLLLLTTFFVCNEMCCVFDCLVGWVADEMTLIHGMTLVQTQREKEKKRWKELFIKCNTF